ncbi:MAG: threonine ammonia-lyase [Candidatus Nanopelagicales bacterium]
MTGAFELADFRAADEVASRAVRRTPMLPAHWLEEAVGGPIHLKAENLQRSGSFKIRGAYVRLSRLTPEERARGVVAASAGNHAQGVALAAADLGIPSTVFMPRTASLPKIVATRGYGAEVRLVGETLADAFTAAAEFVSSTGAVMIPPFDHRDIVLGQGSVGLEIAAEMPDAATVVVPAGGGGLLAGVAGALHAVGSRAQVVAVQAAGCATLAGSFAAGHPVALDHIPTTMADGIAVAQPGAVPFAVAQPLVHRVVEVGEEQIADGILQTLERSKLLAEPAGVVGISAVIADPTAFKPPVVVVVSGGNVDPVLLNRILGHGLALAGRYVAITVRIPDQPGRLAGLLATVAAGEANVLDISHLRNDPRLAVGEVEIVILCETRGPDHRAALVQHVEAAGYRVTID